jgi:glutaredoxin
VSITVYGTGTCEETALVRDRLRALGVSYEMVDLDTDPVADAFVRGRHAGARVTPTVVVDAAPPVAEPSLDMLDALVEASGRPFALPVPVHFHRPLTDRTVPLRTLPVAAPAGGAPSLFSLEPLRGRAQVVLFLGHPVGCLACAGYARQLVGAAPALADVDAAAVIVVPDSPARAGGWAGDYVPQATVVADAERAWGRALAAFVGLPADTPTLLLLDRYLAPRVGASGPEAGALPSPGETVEWLRFLALECPECSLELAWPEAEGSPDSSE